VLLGVALQQGVEVALLGLQAGIEFGRGEASAGQAGITDCH